MARWSIHWGQCLEVFSQMPFNFWRDGLFSLLIRYLCLFPAEASLPVPPRLPLEDHASEKFLWPRSSHGPTQGPGIVAISPSQCTFLLQNFTQTFVCWVSIVLPVHGEFTPFLLRIVISGVPGGSRAKRVFELEMWLWWWHWWQSPCDCLAQQVEKKYLKGPQEGIAAPGLQCRLQSVLG